MVEFRAYYDDKGYVICYTCENLEGNYIVVDSQAFAEGRPDMRVVDGKLVKVNKPGKISKLVPSDTGVRASRQDMLVIVTDDTPSITWKFKTYE